MTYNVFCGTLSLTQSVNQSGWSAPALPGVVVLLVTVPLTALLKEAGVAAQVARNPRSWRHWRTWRSRHSRLRPWPATLTLASPRPTSAGTERVASCTRVRSTACLTAATRPSWRSTNQIWTTAPSTEWKPTTGMAVSCQKPNSSSKVRFAGDRPVQ